MTLKGNKRFNEIAQNRYFRPESMVDGNFAESQVQSGDSSEDVGHPRLFKSIAARRDRLDPLTSRSSGHRLGTGAT